MITIVSDYGSALWINIPKSCTLENVGDSWMKIWFVACIFWQFWSQECWQILICNNVLEQLQWLQYLRIGVTNDPFSQPHCPINSKHNFHLKICLLPRWKCVEGYNDHYCWPWPVGGAGQVDQYIPMLPAKLQCSISLLLGKYPHLSIWDTSSGSSWPVHYASDRTGFPKSRRLDSDLYGDPPKLQKN